MQVEHSRVMMNKDNEHRKALEAKEVEHKEETNILNSIINTAHRWYPDFAHLLRLERLAKQIGLSAMEFAELINRIPLSQWFSEQYDKLRQSIRQPIQPKKSRGMKL